jgi:hypothetical protein
VHLHHIPHYFDITLHYALHPPLIGGVFGLAHPTDLHDLHGFECDVTALQGDESLRGGGNILAQGDLEVEVDGGRLLGLGCLGGLEGQEVREI